MLFKFFHNIAKIKKISYSYKYTYSNSIFRVMGELMKATFLCLIATIFLVSGMSLFAQQSDKKEIKTFIFGQAEITGTNNKPAGVNIDTVGNKDMRTKVSPRENFLPELSSSVDEI